MRKNLPSLLKSVLLYSAVCFAASATEVRSLVTLPLQFEENQGQIAGQVRYLLRGGGVAGFFTDEAALFRLGGSTGASTVRVELVGRREGVSPRGEDRAVSQSNYFLGNDAARWRTAVPHFGRIRYEEIYDGIDLVYYGRNRELEYDFVLQPGAATDAVRMRFHGADSLRLTAEGHLLVTAGAHRMVHRLPYVFQKVDSDVREVAARYVIGEDNLVGFQVDEFNRDLPLVIDPVVEFSTYVGGSGVDQNLSIQVDAAGYIYIAGETRSTDFPVTAGAYDTSHNGPTADGSGDLFVLKMMPDGSSLVHATFLGGSGNESSTCKGNTVAVDGTGRIYLSGTTSSVNYPVKAGAYDTSYNGGNADGEADGDAVLTVLSPDGTKIEYSTYFGGTDWEEDACVALGVDGVPVVALQTGSTNLATTASAFATRSAGESEIFIARINPAKTGAASLEYATYLGGSDWEADPSFIVLPDGALAMVCETRSLNFPVTAGAFDATFNGTKDLAVLVLDTMASGPAGLRYSTYFGGSGDDAIDGSGIAIGYDRAGDLYIVGETLSTLGSAIPLPITRNAFQLSHAEGAVPDSSVDDTFFTRIRPANKGAQDLIYSTYLGGREDDQDGTIAVSSEGYAFLVLQTASPDFPVKDPLQGEMAGEEDFAVSVFDPEGKLVFSTYLGGTARERDPVAFLSGQMGPRAAVAELAQRRAAMAPALYFAGETFSTDYPTTAGVFARQSAGSVDAVAAKLSGFDFLPAATPLATTLSAASFTAPVAPASIATVYIEGANYPFAFPGEGPAPTTLGDLSVKLSDSAKTQFSPQLFFVGANQINLYIDDAAALGEATVNVFERSELVGAGTIQISRIAPGIFFVGNRIAAAFSLTVNPDNSRVQVETFDATLAPRPIDLGPEGTGVYLLLFGSGIRAGAGNVTVTVGGESVPMLGALAHGTFIGLDQANAGPLPRSLAGRGLVDVIVTVDGVVANVVQIRIK